MQRVAGLPPEGPHGASVYVCPGENETHALFASVHGRREVCCWLKKRLLPPLYHI